MSSQEKQRRLRKAPVEATHIDSRMAVKPLKVAEFVVTCMNNHKEEKVVEKREQSDPGLHVANSRIGESRAYETYSIQYGGRCPGIPGATGRSNRG